MDTRIQRPFELHDRREVYWVRQWVIGQIKGGRLGVSYQHAEYLDSIEKVQGFIAQYLDTAQRRRLNKALSARRARHKASTNMRMASPSVRRVSSEMTLEARTTLQAVATSRGITTSELILSTFGDEYDRLPK